jgi:hypothetical protein
LAGLGGELIINRLPRAMPKKLRKVVYGKKVNV